RGLRATLCPRVASSRICSRRRRLRPSPASQLTQWMWVQSSFASARAPSACLLSSSGKPLDAGTECCGMDSASHGFSAAQESRRQLFRHCLTLAGSLRLILVERLVGFPPEFFVPFAFELV